MPNMSKSNMLYTNHELKPDYAEELWHQTCNSQGEKRAKDNMQTHLNHFEGLEEAGVWEKGSITDRHAVPAPEATTEDQTGFMF